MIVTPMEMIYRTSRMRGKIYGTCHLRERKVLAGYLNHPGGKNEYR